MESFLLYHEVFIMVDLLLNIESNLAYIYLSEINQRE